jgi:hypothetical protein
MIKAINPKDMIGMRKAPMSGLPAPVLMECGLVKLHGDLKYGAYNWREVGVKGSEYYNAVWRHLTAWYEGQDLDPDSGEHHIAHAIAGLAVLRDSQMFGNWVDDRPISHKPGWLQDMNKRASEMIDKSNQLLELTKS